MRKSCKHTTDLSFSFTFFIHHRQGQTESKKAGKVKGPTKGETISFGFKKRTQSTGAIKKTKFCDTAGDKAKAAANNNGELVYSDDNGNSGGKYRS